MRNWLIDHWISLTALCVSLIAAIFSGINVYLNWRVRRRALRLTVKTGPMMFTPSGRPVSKEQILISVKNIGAPTTLTNLRFEVAGAKGFFPVSNDGPLPVHPLGHLEVKTFYSSPTKLAVALKKAGVIGEPKTRVVASDNTGLIAKSRRFRFDIPRWLAQNEADEKLMMEMGRRVAEKMAELRDDGPKWPSR